MKEIIMLETAEGSLKGRPRRLSVGKKYSVIEQVAEILINNKYAEYVTNKQKLKIKKKSKKKNKKKMKKEIIENDTLQF